MNIVSLKNLKDIESISSIKEVSFPIKEIEDVILDWQVGAEDYKLDDKADMEVFIENYMEEEGYSDSWKELSQTKYKDLRLYDKYTVCFAYLNTTSEHVTFKTIVTSEEIEEFV